MEVMILYYIALPWIVFGLNKLGRPVLWLALAIIAAALWRFIYLTSQPEDATQFFLTMLETKTSSPAGFELYFRPWFRLPAFLMGTILAFMMAARMIPKTTITPIIAVLVIGLIVWLPVQDKNSAIYSQFGETVWALYWALGPVVFARAFGFLMVWGLLRGQEKPWRIVAPLRAFSTNIFSVYLFHMPFLAVGAIIVFRTMDVTALGQAGLWQILAVFVLTACLTYLFAWPLTRFVEQPLQKLIRRKLT